MNIEKYLIDYEKLKVGDKLWSIQSGDCELESIDDHSYPLCCANRDWGRTSYTKDGRRTIYDTHPSLFTSNPFAEGEPEQITLSGPISVHFGNCGPDPEDVADNPESILQEAERLINGDRREAYGDAHENFTKIAIGWAEIFKDGVTAEKVALAMIWLKICRFLNKPGHDSVVDIAGYAGCLEKIMKGGKK